MLLLNTIIAIFLERSFSDPIKHSIHHKAEFVILSVVLHSDDSLQKYRKKLQTIRTKTRSYPDRSMNCIAIGINFDFYPDGPYQMALICSTVRMRLDFRLDCIFSLTQFSVGLFQSGSQDCCNFHRVISVIFQDYGAAGLPCKRIPT